MPGQEPIIPPELEGIIEIHENLDFVEFYNLLHYIVSWRSRSCTLRTLTLKLWSRDTGCHVTCFQAGLS